MAVTLTGHYCSEMTDRLVFVSCGQRTNEEIGLGREIKAVIDGTAGFEAFFAEEVHSLEALSEVVFDALRRCSAAVIVLHDRGRVTTESGEEPGTRSSVWINQ